MKTKISFVVLFLININLLISQEKEKLHSIDLELDECLSLDSNHTTIGMRICTDEAIKKWDKELNKTYNLLLTKLSAEEKKALISSQRSWLKYNNSEGDFISLYYGNFLGTMWPLISAKNYLELIRQRTLILQSYLEHIENR